MRQPAVSRGTRLEPAPDPTCEVDRRADRPRRCIDDSIVVIIQDALGPVHALLEDNTHWLAGIVTTGADPFTPVSAIENSSIMMPNVYLDWISVFAIQNHLLVVLRGNIGVLRRRICDQHT